MTLEFLKKMAAAAILSVAMLTNNLALTGEAAAQVMQCGERDPLIKSLNDKFREKRFGIGLITNARLIELFVSDSGTWTMLMTRPDGITCIVAAGSNWISAPVAGLQGSGV